MTRITEYEIVDHGIDGSQYFQGCGVSFTKYEHAVTGCGNDFAEAMLDALDSMAQMEETSGVDFEAFEASMLADEKLEAWPDNVSVAEDSEDMYYYVSIRYNVAECAE